MMSPKSTTTAMASTLNELVLKKSFKAKLPPVVFLQSQMRTAASLPAAVPMFSLFGLAAGRAGACSPRGEAHFLRLR